MERVAVILLAALAGATLTVAATAAIAFPTMKALDPVLGAYGAWPDPHWPIAAGAVANRVFRIVDWTSLVIAIVVLVSLTAKLRGSVHSPRSIVCVLAVVGLAAVIGVNWAWLRPAMHGQIQAYWSAAQAGDIATGRLARESFDRLHPFASAMLMAQVVLALLGAATIRSHDPRPEH